MGEIYKDIEMKRIFSHSLHDGCISINEDIKVEFRTQSGTFADGSTDLLLGRQTDNGDTLHVWKSLWRFNSFSLKIKIKR